MAGCVDDAAGGVISFDGNAGEGMHFFNVDTSFFIPDEDIGDVEEGLVLSDLQTHTSGIGGRLYQINFQVGGADPGDFDKDGDLDADDLDDLSLQIRENGMDSVYDLNDDSNVNDDDRTVWVKELKFTWFGDANLDGEFNTTD